MVHLFVGDAMGIIKFLWLIYLADFFNRILNHILESTFHIKNLHRPSDRLLIQYRCLFSLSFIIFGFYHPFFIQQVRITKQLISTNFRFMRKDWTLRCKKSPWLKTPLFWTGKVESCTRWWKYKQSIVLAAYGWSLHILIDNSRQIKKN